jgi:hypothetical protein
MDVLLANPDVLAALDDEQRGWLQQAAGDAANRSAVLAGAKEDARTLRGMCGLGGRFASASKDDLEGLRDAFASVYASLEQDPQTRAFIERIQSLKRSTPAGPRLAIPPGCTGDAPQQPTAPKGTAPAYLNGTYRWVFTQEEVEEAGEAEAHDPEAVWPQVVTITLKDGNLEGGCFGSGGGSYRVSGDRITFHSVEYDYNTTVTFRRNEHGDLQLTPVPPIEPGDAFACFSQVWKKIG